MMNFVCSRPGCGTRYTSYATKCPKCAYPVAQLDRPTFDGSSVSSTDPERKAWLDALLGNLDTRVGTVAASAAVAIRQLLHFEAEAYALEGRVAEANANVAELELRLAALEGKARNDEPVAVQSYQIGVYGKAYAPPGAKRAYTYRDQPDNVGAMKLGRAAGAAKAGGDSIDHGLSLLEALLDEGFGVFEVAALSELQGAKP